MLIKNLIEKHRNKIKQREDDCNNKISLCRSTLENTAKIFDDKEKEIIPERARYIHENMKQALITVSESSLSILRKAQNYETLVTEHAKLKNETDTFRGKVAKHNTAVLEKKIAAASALIGNVEGKPLDRQQLMCIIKDANNHLVIAGAGTGKTTTVVGRIKYMLLSGICLPEDILVLSFTNASASEMNIRINNETGRSIDASTFHKLGLNIIASVQGKKPDICDLQMSKFIKENIARLLNDRSYMELMLRYINFYRVLYRSEFSFNNEREYNEYLRLNPPTTINGETVKSYGEMDIANFLTLNGVNYVYEQAYKIDTADIEHRQYHPDFYLPDYDIYIEYFGINRKNEVPAYFSAAPGKTASQTYNESIAWKRELHKQNNTKMIEVYAYEKMEDILLDSLRKNLTECGVVLEEKPLDKAWEETTKDNNVLGGIYELFATVINLIKSNNYTVATVRELNRNSPFCKINEMILDLIEPIYNAYNDYLQKNGQIDFNDMINLAAEYVRQGKYNNPYKYVIVDEYQDLAKSRFNLLKALRDSNYYKLFCVGDDWQSIYRFAGSDIGYIIDFERFWGATEKSKIETTYRFPKTLIEISGGFIMQNPMQIKKDIKAKNVGNGFPLGEINAYNERFAVEFMLKRMNDLPQNSNVFLIGRYNYDANMLKDNSMLTYGYDNSCGMVNVRYSNRPDLKIQFLSAHKSKGLQADYVFILNNKNTRSGFPSKIQDAPILKLLLEGHDDYPYSEERRLFYVALTRAKQKAFLLTIENHESEFVSELHKRYEKEMKNERFECPLCGGKVIRKNGRYGAFYGCSNYTKGCRYTRDI